MNIANDSISTLVIQLLAEARQQQNLTMEELADHASVHRTYIGLLERGERQPTLDVVVRLADALGIRLSNLIQQAEDQSRRSQRNTAIDTPAPSVELVQSPSQRLVSRGHFRASGVAILREITGLDIEAVALAVESTYHTFDLIDEQLLGKGSPPISQLIELANLSSMLGNLLGAGIESASNGLYIRNRPHSYPDLLPQKEGLAGLEIKTAIEANRPKGHLAKAGNYLTFRYALTNRHGAFVRGKENRGNVVAIWEIKCGLLTESDFSLSNTVGDSGKTAVVKKAAFDAMHLVYYLPDLDPFARRQHPPEDAPQGNTFP